MLDLADAREALEQLAVESDGPTARTCERLLERGDLTDPQDRALVMILGQIVDTAARDLDGEWVADDE